MNTDELQKFRATLADKQLKNDFSQIFTDIKIARLQAERWNKIEKYLSGELGAALAENGIHEFEFEECKVTIDYDEKATFTWRVVQ